MHRTSVKLSISKVKSKLEKVLPGCHRNDILRKEELLPFECLASKRNMKVH